MRNDDVVKLVEANAGKTATELARIASVSQPGLNGSLAAMAKRGRISRAVGQGVRGPAWSYYPAQPEHAKDCAMAPGGDQVECTCGAASANFGD